MLVKHFEDIFDVQYTARMEEELDEVEEGKMTWVQALDEFYKKFEKDLKKASKNMENLKAQEIPTDEVCEKCGSPMVQEVGPVRKLPRVLRLSRMQEHEGNCHRGDQAEGRRKRRRRQSRSPAKIAASRWR